MDFRPLQTSGLLQRGSPTSMATYEDVYLPRSRNCVCIGSSVTKLIYSRHQPLKIDVIWMVKWLTEACCPIAGCDITAYGLDQPR